MGKKKAKSKVSKHVNVLSETLKISNSLSLSSLDKNMDVFAAALSTANQAVFVKVCRLCESKDGPFLNIFDADKVTAKKIDELMPFGIAENDDLTHKICFRCSAKVEELYEFIQKCIKTQHNLHTAMGKKTPILTKTKTRTLWEEKLNKSNISNDDICDALIKKAMEGVKNIPLKGLPKEEEKTASVVASKKEKPRIPTPVPAPKRETRNKSTRKESDEDAPLKQTKSNNKIEENNIIPQRTSRSKNTAENLLDGLQDNNKKKTNKVTGDLKSDETVKNINIKKENSDVDATNTQEISKPVEIPKPFDIMSQVSMIKVNGVGVLFQCKLCNRNFLKKEVVMSHACAKTGVPKVDFTKHVPPPNPPKLPVVKYINTKIDGDLTKPTVETSHTKDIETNGPTTESKPKPKIGPASKVKRDSKDYQSVIGMKVIPIEETSPPKATTPPTPSTNNSGSSVTFGPSLNSRYKLLPGPNNTFTLVEENSAANTQESQDTTKTGKKRKSDEDAISPALSKTRKQLNENKKKASPEIINLDDQPPTPPRKSVDQPYPVGLFQTVAHHSSMYPPPIVPDPPFTTPAMKKQSYTIVQTGNPSKLLISTKPQPVTEEVPKKRVKKSKPDPKTDSGNKQPFSVTLEDAAHPKDSFFTFINVDPLLQPSYVLPTHNIIQESQISTSTPASKANIDSKDKDKYTCNMCSESFTREKKLLAHIQSHYSKMDEEDQKRAEKGTKKRTGRKGH